MEPGRARGRARGRAKATVPTAVAAAGEETRRPGEQVQQVPVAASAAATAPGGNNGGGRRMHRGAPRTEPAVQQVTGAMAGLEIIDSSGRGRSRDGPAVHTRPASLVDKKGSAGEPIRVLANYFELVQRPQWVVFQYHVEFAPIVESSRMRRIFMRDHKEKLGDCFLFDGMSDLKCIRNVENKTELFSTRKTDNETIRITLKLVAELAPTHPELGRLYNTQMRRNLQHLNYNLMGRYFFDPKGISEIPQFNLQIWQGVITSIRQQEERLMMCVDTTHKVVRKETALNVIRKLAETGGNYKELVARDLVGSIVMTGYNNRTYSVEDVDWEQSPASTFESRAGPQSYMDYYQKQYDLQIRDIKQPLLLCKSKEREVKEGASGHKKIFLIPELCFLTGITDQMRADFTMMKELANKTRLDPSLRVKNLMTFMDRLNANEQIVKEMSAWEMKFSPTLVECPARIVPGEKIVLADRTTSYNQQFADFSKEMRGHSMLAAKNLDDWILIVTRYDEGKARDFLTNLHRVCPPMGMRVNDPKFITIQQDRNDAYLRAFQDNVTRDTCLVCFVVPNNKKERYDALKKHACLTAGIPSQVIVARTLSKKQMLMSVATKIGIQLNCKLGGEPWGVEIPFKMRIMVIGYDTYHDSAKRGRSAGAFVASLNQNLTRWYSRVSFHSSGGWAEITNSVKVNFTDALKKYQQVNNALPDLILYYRDGVGDGQIQYVIDWEVKPFKEVINGVMAGRPTKFAFIVVNKKINTRFFHNKGNTQSNPPPGTVVDSTVTRFDRYDFFLVSQSVRQGTVAPTMYNIIEDSSGLKPEHMQRLSYKLTHLYFNWPGTIRVPAPCQYAHKLAFLTGQSLHAEPNEALSDTLFYL